MIATSFNELGTDVFKKKDEEKEYVTQTLSLSVVTIDKNYTAIMSNLSVQINGAYVQLSSIGSTTSDTYYKCTMQVPKDDQSFTIRITHPDFYAYTNYVSSYTEISQRITMISEGNFWISWKLNNSSSDRDIDTHLIIKNNNPNSSNYGKTHEIGYNVHTDKSNMYKYGDGVSPVGSANLSSWLSRDDTSSQSGGETAVITPISPYYNYYLVCYAWSSKVFTNATTTASLGYNGNVQKITLSAQTAAKPYWEVLKIEDGHLTQLNNYTDVNTYNISKTASDSTTII